MNVCKNPDLTITINKSTCQKKASKNKQKKKNSIGDRITDSAFCDR